MFVSHSKPTALIKRVAVVALFAAVIGETAVVGNNVSIMQSVTLGGTGKDDGDRHPKGECRRGQIQRRIPHESKADRDRGNRCEEPRATTTACRGTPVQEANPQLAARGRPET